MDTKDLKDWNEDDTTQRTPASQIALEAGQRRARALEDAQRDYARRVALIERTYEAEMGRIRNEIEGWPETLLGFPVVWKEGDDPDWALHARRGVYYDPACNCRLCKEFRSDNSEAFAEAGERARADVERAARETVVKAQEPAPLPRITEGGYSDAVTASLHDPADDACECEVCANVKAIEDVIKIRLSKGEQTELRAQVKAALREPPDVEDAEMMRGFDGVLDQPAETDANEGDALMDFFSKPSRIYSEED